MEETQKLIRIIIAEDDQPVRQLIESYLTEFPQVDVVASVSNGCEVLEMADKLKPTAAFLDISMPDIDGLSLAMRLKGKHPDLLVVFVTAYTSYAAEAYQLDAVDYLVKPVTREVVARAITRIERLLPSVLKRSELKAVSDHITVKNRYETYFIQLKDIIYVEKEQRKTIFHTENGLYLTGEGINSLGQKLDLRFFRCHRGFIINTTKINKVTPIADRVYEVSFHKYSGNVPMGRKKFEELCSLMSETRNKFYQLPPPPPPKPPPEKPLPPKPPLPPPVPLPLGAEKTADPTLDVMAFIELLKT